MKVNELLEELLNADRNGSVVIGIQTPMGFENVEIGSVHHYKWGVEIDTEQIGCEIDG